MKSIKVPRPLYVAKHLRWGKVADTTHVGGDAGLHDVVETCTAYYPSTRCPCGEYRIEWWM